MPPKTLTVVLPLCLMLEACGGDSQAVATSDATSDTVQIEDSLTLSGSHQVIAAYYPIFPRWWLGDCQKLFVGNTVRQLPLLHKIGSDLNEKRYRGLYGNKSEDDRGVLSFDFEAMRRAGVTAVNPHVFTRELPTVLLSLIDSVARNRSIQWTPTFESFAHDPAGLANITIEALDLYASSPAFFAPGGRPTLFWYVEATQGVTVDDIAAAARTVRSRYPNVRLILDTAGTVSAPSQGASGGAVIDSRLRGKIDGFYSWVSVHASASASRRSIAQRYLSLSNQSGVLPVFSVTPSYDESNWGYSATSCGIGDRRNQPRYNTERRPDEWQRNLDDSLAGAPSNAWLYIQAYDEFGEGSTLAPTTFSCFSFLQMLRERLQAQGWHPSTASYCRPPTPAGYEAEGCSMTPVCGTNAPPPPKACTAPAPIMLVPSGTTIAAGTTAITWLTPWAGLTYDVRIDDQKDGWGPPTCRSSVPAGMTGDLCLNGYTHDAYFGAISLSGYKFIAGHRYRIWIHSVNACGEGQVEERTVTAE